MKNAINLLFLLLSLSCWGWGKPKESTQTTLEIRFQCLWWSESQMEGLNLNAPPSKSTPVTLEKWEYSDPIGVPHPDTVDVFAKLTPKGGKLPEGEFSSEVRWKIGPIVRKAEAKWSPYESLGTAKSPATNSDLDLKVGSIAVKAKQDPLFAKNRWPWMAEVRVKWQPKGESPPITTIATLPIQPGD